jgi:hypothetical protein
MYRCHSLGQLSVAAGSAVLLVCSTGLLAQNAPAAPANAKIWIGRATEIEDYLRTAEITKLDAISVGVMHPRKATLKPGGPVEFLAFKAIAPGVYDGDHESYKSEIAAYEIDKLLHLDMVPPTVEKTYKGQKGAAVMWASPTKSFFELGGPPVPPKDHLLSFGFMIAQAKMFDCLIGDPDPNLGNWLVDPAWNIILIDHSRALTTDTGFFQPLRYIDPDLWDRMKAITLDSLTQSVGKWLDKDAIKAVIQRRDKMQKMIDDLVKKYGAANVFVKAG